MNQRHYTFEDLVDIIAILRSPDGCPWDREQTHSSIRQSFIEECYEAVETLENGDWQHMREELGDVLLQLLLHSQIEAEQSHFTMHDVCDELAGKMVQRHPHVFGSVKVSDSSDVLEVWDSVKESSRNQVTAAQKMESVSKALPSLMASHKIGKKGRKAGFDFPDTETALKKTDEELLELKDALAEGDKAHIEEELGDLLLTLTCVARLSGVDSEEALKNANQKFIRRFQALEKLAAKQGVTLDGLSDEKKLELWDKAKKECLA